jgi:thymidine kinase
MRSLRIWTGPVASEKTTKALLAAKRLMRRGNDLVLVRPPCSRRAHEKNTGFLVTKTGDRWPCIDVVSALDIEDAVEGATALWLDEPFMFTDQKKLYAVVRRVLRKADVLISTISSTSEMEPISSSVSALLAIADEVHHCRADCDDCQRLGNASRSWHLAGPKTEKVKTGGEADYEPKCPACWTTRLRKERKTTALA